jgi:DNA-binding CsgD family transcriptional regulator
MLSDNRGNRATLSVSQVTTRRHCADICRKLGIRDRASAVELFLGQLTTM